MLTPINKSFFVLLVISLPGIVQIKAQTPGKVLFINDTTSSFDQLTARFKGHVIYVNFWASWCAPCRMELERKKDVSLFAQFAQKNNVVILYLSGDRNEKDWKGYLAKNPLVGYHTLIGAYIRSETHSRFAVPKSIRHPEAGVAFFIPRHIIVDKEGKVVNLNAESQGSAKVYKQLKQLAAN